jgi:uncharacterized repeat protein (TIGR03917 family)
MAGARNIGDGLFEIAVQPGACAADVSAALDAIPYDAAFVEFYDDVDKILIFEHAPSATATRSRASARPANPEPAASAAVEAAVA